MIRTYLYNQDRDSIFYEGANLYHTKAARGEVRAVVAVQNLVEFMVVMTSPARIIRPQAQKKALAEMNKYYKSGYFEIIYPTEQTLSIFARLLARNKVKKPIKQFDIFLAATMLSNAVSRILTANERDFRIDGITVAKLTR